MAKKTKRAERLVAALSHLHRVEELRKIELQRQFNALRQSEEEVIRSLNSEEALIGGYMETGSRFLRALAREAERVSQAQENQSRRLLDRAGELRRAEKLRDRISERSRQQEGEKVLADVIERYGGKGSSSLP